MMKEITLALIVTICAVPSALASNGKRVDPLETRDDYYRRHAAEDYNYRKSRPDGLGNRQSTAGDLAPANNPYSERRTNTYNHQDSNDNEFSTNKRRGR
ncbi:MAG: hypothetical protein AB7S81_08195 [Bdellovibrionales bacterium]